MPTVAVKPTRIANDWLDRVYEIDENLTFFYICITVNRQEYHDNVPFPAFDCI